MKVRWLVRFNGHDPGFIGEVPDEKGRFWMDRNMVERIKEAKPPRDKMVRKTRTK